MSSHTPSLKRFVGKVAVVTGASSGLGKAIADLLVKHGVIVAGLGRRVERIADHAKQLKREKGELHAFKVDLTEREDIVAVFKEITAKLGPIHVLVNSAGLAFITGIIDGHDEKWKVMLDTNVLAVAACVREAVASMKKHKVKGHIINLNSVAGHRVTDFPLMNVYIASKHAVTALTETIRLEINRENLPIKITSLSPGYVKTEFVDVAFGGVPHNFDTKPGLVPEDIADAVLYILSTPEHVNVKELTVSVQGDF